MTNTTKPQTPPLRGEYRQNALDSIKILLGVLATIGITRAIASYLYSDNQESLVPRVQIEQARDAYSDSKSSETLDNLKFYEKFGISSTNKTITPQMRETLKRRIEQDRYRLANPDEFKGKPLNLWDQEYQSTLEERIKSPITPSYEAPKKNKIPQPYQPNYQDKKNTNPVTLEFIAKIEKRESKSKANAVSPKGARGVMQVMKPTWRQITREIYGKSLDYSKAFDPKINREVGIAYLNKIDDMLTNSFPKYKNMDQKEQQKYIAATYNWGIGNLKNSGFNLNSKRVPKETKDYIDFIASNN